MNLTIEIPTSLIDQQNNLNATLETIANEQNKLAAQKIEAQQSLQRIDQAIRYLRGESIPLVKSSNGRKPMSAEARERIRQGLLKASAAKKAAASAPTAPEVVPAPASVPTSTPKASSGRRATKAA